MAQRRVRHLRQTEFYTELSGLICHDEVEMAFIVDGFDDETGWYPEVCLHRDGSISVEFMHFPPRIIVATEADNGETFDKTIARITGCSIFWEDIEVFWIDVPKPNTYAVLQEFFCNYGVMI